MTFFLNLIWFFCGLMIGSFLNICTYRWSVNKNIVFPPSSCEFCSRNLKWFHNVPVFSFLILGGKCFFCKKNISFLHPFIEIFTAFYFLVLSVQFSRDFDLLFKNSLLISFLIVLGTIDFIWKILPHNLNNVFALTGIFALLLNKGFQGAIFFKAVGDFVLIGMIFLFVYLLMSDSLGGGDVKIMAFLTFWLGLKSTIYACCCAFGLGSFFAILFLAFKLIHRRSHLPLGPFLMGSVSLELFY